MTSSGRGAADLLRSIGLMADGPVAWGRPVGGRGPGLYLVELPSAPSAAPIDLARVTAWLARTPGLRVDHEVPTPRALAARISAFWLPGEPLLFAGATDLSIGGRATALVRHVLGDRKPHAEGHWLHVLNGLAATRIWWAPTDAPDEYLDALLTDFSTGLRDAARGHLPDQEVVLPFATTRRPTGERKKHGITGAVAPAEPAREAASTRVTTLPPGAALGAESTAPGPGLSPRPARPPAATTGVRRRGTSGQPRSATPRTAQSLSPSPRRTATRSGAASGRRRAMPGALLTEDGVTGLQAELDGLVRVKRPQVVARIRAAKELGDLKENADYTSAREEQSFLEGRVQAIEALLRDHVVIEARPAGGTTVHLGSRVTIESDAVSVTYSIVGSTESNPVAGRISASSPVGAALIGRSIGDEVPVRTPTGEVRYRVVAIE